MQAVVADAAVHGAHMLVLEQEDSLLWWDRQRLFALTRQAEYADTLRYEHHRGAAEELLWIPDAIAWCWSRSSRRNRGRHRRVAASRWAAATP